MRARFVVFDESNPPTMIIASTHCARRSTASCWFLTGLHRVSIALRFGYFVRRTASTRYWNFSRVIVVWHIATV